MIRGIGKFGILLLISLASAEITLRAAGISPVPRSSPATESRLNYFKEDQRLGWYHRPGVKKIFPIKNEPPYTVTILENGARATSKPHTPAHDVLRRDLIFVGCSFTHGFGLNDEETYAWKVQAALPDWNVHNFGVNGYGTCQAYMLLKRLFESQKWHKPVVIYGFIDAHEERNVADYLWHSALSTLSSTGNVSLPSCMLDSSGSIVFNAVRPYPRFPLRHTLAVIPLFERLYLKFKGASLASQKRRITEELLVEMDAFTKSQSGHFGVLFFDAGRGRTGPYRQFLETRQSQIIDITVSKFNNIGPLTFVDGHPNSRMTDLIAENVVNFVGTLSAKAAAGSGA